MRSEMRRCAKRLRDACRSIRPACRLQGQSGRPFVHCTPRCFPACRGEEQLRCTPARRDDYDVVGIGFLREASDRCRSWGPWRCRSYGETPNKNAHTAGVTTNACISAQTGRVVGAPSESPLIPGSRRPTRSIWTDEVRCPRWEAHWHGPDSLVPRPSLLPSPTLLLDTAWFPLSSLPHRLTALDYQESLTYTPQL
jgi:hypothetical protein